MYYGAGTRISILHALSHLILTGVKMREVLLASFYLERLSYSCTPKCQLWNLMPGLYVSRDHALNLCDLSSLSTFRLAVSSACNTLPPDFSKTGSIPSFTQLRHNIRFAEDVCSGLLALQNSRGRCSHRM